VAHVVPPGHVFAPNGMEVPFPVEATPAAVEKTTASDETLDESIAGAK